MSADALCSFLMCVRLQSITYSLNDCTTLVWVEPKPYPIAEFVAEFLSAEKNTDIRIFVYFLRENHICFNFRAVVTWLNSLLHAFSAELLTVILCRLLVTVITHLVENGCQSNFTFNNLIKCPAYDNLSNADISRKRWQSAEY